MAARLGVVTGQGLSDLIRDRFGVRWTVFAMLVLLIANIANTVAEFAGASAALEIFGISRYIVVPVVAVGDLGAGAVRVSTGPWSGCSCRWRSSSSTYIASAILAHPDWSAVGTALVTPTLDLAPATLLLMVALVGTTITPYMQFYLQSAVAEKGIGEEELRLEQADAVVGLDLDQRDRRVHRRRDRGDDLRDGRPHHDARRTRREASSPSPGRSRRRCSRSGSSGRPCSRRRSCRSAPPT